jgi:biotin carboxylase
MKLKQLRERFFKNSNIELASAIVNADYSDAGVSAAQTSNMINNHDREVLELANGDYVICSAQTRIVKMTTENECKITGARVRIVKPGSACNGFIGFISGYSRSTNEYTITSEIGVHLGWFFPCHFELA